MKGFQTAIYVSPVILDTFMLSYIRQRAETNDHSLLNPFHLKWDVLFVYEQLHYSNQGIQNGMKHESLAYSVRSFSFTWHGLHKGTVHSRWIAFFGG